MRIHLCFSLIVESFRGILQNTSVPVAEEPLKTESSLKPSYDFVFSSAVQVLVVSCETREAGSQK